MVFDLQRFDDEIYLATSADETVRITKINDGVKATNQREGKTEKTLKPVTKGNALSGVNAGEGNDYITVAADVGGISILGGRGKDTVDLAATRTATDGITYVYNYGDGVDVIRGWNPTKDILAIDGDWYSPVMSEDGNNFLINYGSGQIKFEGLNYGDRIMVIDTDTSVVKLYLVERKMQGTSRDETISNTAAALGDNVTKHASASDKVWTIDAAEGNDVITNEFNYVSINGGWGNDNIVVTNSGTVTEGVTIQGGWGNDTIDVRGDTVNGADFKTGANVGGHVYEFGTQDGYDSIYGYNGSDSIVFIGASDISADVNVYGNFVITAGSTIITIVKPDGQELGGTKLNVFTKASESAGAVALTPAGYKKLIATPVYDGSGNIDYYTIPKKILLSNAANEANYGTDYDNYTIDAAGGADTLVVSGKAMSINSGNANDFITVTGGTNVEDNGNINLSNTVTIYGGYGNDSIDALTDFKVVNGETVRAGHVYEIDQYDGRDTIVGFNENDTIRLLGTFNAASDIYTAFDATGKYFIFTYVGTQIYIDVTKDYFKGGKTINIVNENGAAVDGIAGSYLTKVSLDASGNETTDTLLATSWEYIVPRILQGTDDSITGDTLVNTDDYFSINALNGDDTITNSGNYVTIYGGAGNDSILNSGTNTTYIYSGSSEGTDTITGFNQATDLIYVEDSGASVSFALNENDNLVVTIGSTTVLLEGISSGSVRYKIGDGDIQTYTIA